jgi:hypothetical protein
MIDLHVVDDDPLIRRGWPFRDEGPRTIVQVRWLESHPDWLLGRELHDAFLHVPVSEALLTRIRMRVGRRPMAPGTPRGRVWGPV